MKIKAQIAMVLNLDKCLGCHTCSIPCKNAWTTAPGAEYMWFNNVETKPGIGYPKQWENQLLHKGGWRSGTGRAKLAAGGKWKKLTEIFANPLQPTMDEYYEPWDFDYQNLTTSPAVKHQPTARAFSRLTGKPMTPKWGPNWEDDLGGAHVTGLDDPNFAGLDAKMWLQFKDVFMMHLPRLCEHCLHPACVASCPSGALYKRDEDGIVLVDQERCRSWRYCVSGCPYKKVYFNWKSHHSQKCLLCYPRIEAGEPTLCSQSCVGRIRSMGVMLYDAEKVGDMAAIKDDKQLYEAQLSLFLDPHDPDIIRQAEADGIPFSYMEAARRSPIRSMVVDWRIALPLHPEFRTLPMVWYVPPTSPLRPRETWNMGNTEPSLSAPVAATDIKGTDIVDHMRIPLRFLANLFTAGDEAPVRAALLKLVAMRQYMRQSRNASLAPQQESPQARTDGQTDTQAGTQTGTQAGTQADEHQVSLEAAGLTVPEVEAMYRLLAIARYEERFVIPTAHREQTEDPEVLKAEAGYPASDCTEQSRVCQSCVHPHSNRNPAPKATQEG